MLISSPELLSFHSRALEMPQSCRRSGESGCTAGALLHRCRRTGCQGIAATVAALVVLLDLLSALAQPEPAQSSYAWSPAFLARHPVPRPRCFAYSASRRAYACLGFIDTTGTTAEPRRDHRRGFIDVIGLPDGRTLQQAHRVSGSKAAPQEDINSRLAALGFSVQLPRASRLVPGRWLRAGGAEVFFRLRVSEGSASYENFGDLSVRCPDGHRVPIDVRGRGLELGEDAWAFWVPGEPVLAVSVHGDDGGEGATDHFVNTVVVDVPMLCAGRRGIAGPIAGRNVGP